MPSRFDATTITRRFPSLDRVQPVLNQLAIPPAGARRRWCSKPFEHMEIGKDGDVFLCCPGWQPASIGNVLDTPALEIWQGAPAKAIRESIRTDTFRWCTACPVLASVTGAVHHVEAAPIPSTDRIAVLNLAYDRTCNLTCPSCRTAPITHNTGPAYDRLQEIQNRVLPLFPYVDLLNITGSGDPFASRTYRDLLRSLDPAAYPNMRLRLHTNALLFTHAVWETLGSAREMLTTVLVSIDAATPETYSVNRRGGDWATLRRNLAFVSRLGRTLRLCFVVQANNWREMPAFVTMARGYGAVVQFQKLRSWITYSPEEYTSRAVHLAEHPERGAFLQLLPALAAGDVDLSEFGVDLAGV